MKNKKLDDYHYPININWSLEDECFIAYSPSFTKYLTAFGDTYAQALKEFKVALKLHIEYCEDNNILLPKVKNYTLIKYKKIKL